MVQEVYASCMNFKTVKEIRNIDGEKWEEFWKWLVHKVVHFLHNAVDAVKEFIEEQAHLVRVATANSMLLQMGRTDGGSLALLYCKFRVALGLCHHLCVEVPGEFQFHAYLCRLVDVLVLMHSLDFLLICGQSTEKALGVYTPRVVGLSRYITYFNHHLESVPWRKQTK